MQRRLASALISMGLFALSCEAPTTHGLPSVSAAAATARPTAAARVVTSAIAVTPSRPHNCWPTGGYAWRSWPGGAGARRALCWA